MAKILIIDDEEAFRNTISKALRKAGYAVCEVDNATDALTLARNGAFDLIISDIAMEGCDGITFLKQIRSTTETATVPFLFVSGHADLETMKIGAEEDADGILPKPFTLQTLLSTVSRRVKREELVRKRSDDIKLQLQSILEASPDFIGIIDPEDGRFTFINSSGRKMLGLGAYDDMGPIGFDAIHAPEEPVKASSIISLASNGTMWSGEALLQKRTGETFPVKLYVQGHSEADGHITYLSVIAHDLSESKRLEEDRKKMELQLTQAHKLESIGQLAAGIAHEINTPTQYIGDNTRFLQDAFGSLVSLLQTYQQIFDCAAAGSITPALLAALERKKERADLEFFLKEIPQAIQQSLDGLDRVTKIVRAMKDFSHPGVVEKTPIDINHAIESTVTVAKNEWKYVADLELNLDRSLPLVPCVPGEINQLILNLVVNAAHAIQEVVEKKPGTKGTISITTARVASGIEIRIRDTGPGIPEKIRNKIFEPFFTTKQVGKADWPGFGDRSLRCAETQRHDRFRNRNRPGRFILHQIASASRVGSGSVSSSGVGTNRAGYTSLF